MHLFLYGPSGAGKTTLIRAALRQAGIVPAGFSTKKLALAQPFLPDQGAPQPVSPKPDSSYSSYSCGYSGGSQATHQVLLGPPDMGQPANAADAADSIGGKSAASVNGIPPGSLGGNLGGLGSLGSFSSPATATAGPGPSLVGLCGPAGILAAYPQAFDTAGVALLAHIPAGSLVLMDELGFLEKEAYLFQNRVLEILEGPYRVLGVIKEKSDPFLDRVKRHPLVQCLPVEETSRLQTAARLRLFLEQ